MSIDDRSDDDVLSDEQALPPVPADLEYLVEPAIQYGRKYRFDDDVQWFLENAEESDLEALAGLAKRARLSGDYKRYLQWSYEVDDVVDRILDECYPYKADISRHQKELLRLINEANDPPDVAERWRESRLRRIVEANDRSEIAERRKGMRMQLIDEANNKVHDMDIYFLFGLMDACDMAFE